MKARLVMLSAVCLTALTFSATSIRSQTVVTFDDLPSSLGGALIPAGYQGLSWSNFAVTDAILRFNNGYVDGYYYGMVSPSNVALNAGGSPAEIDSPGTNFNFLSAFLTGAWKSNLNIEVQGFSGTNLVYDETKIVSATNPTLFTFNYLDIDRLYFNSYGGEEAFGPNDGNNLVMDNFTFEFIPEPSSLLLTILGVVSLWVFIKRRHR
ncbi:MAG: PEP-CTERM sorting domain-containing protein [Verrucomicrobiia bacterium]